MTDAEQRMLIVEDERAQRIALSSFFKKRGWTIDAVGCAEDAFAKLQAQRYDILITDLRLPDESGIEVTRRAREIDEQLGVLLITANASLDSAIKALRLGAHDYLLKPLILGEVGRRVDHLVQHKRLLAENARLRAAVQANARSSSDLVAHSPSMKTVEKLIERAARTRATVLITGETGSGKEVVARTIHQLSPWRDEPFLAVNLAAVPEEMIASKLFGHERGAFTGAERRREGVLRAAGQGTVLLDEIGELTDAVQVQMLRALEAREVQPLGSDRSAPFKARIISATHRDLEEQVNEGAFREDLYFRLNVLQIRVPPLRERTDDIPDLARTLLAHHAQRIAMPSPTIAPDVMRAFCRYPWRGNVRELSNVLERSLIFADEGTIELEHLPPEFRETTEARTWNLKDALEAYERIHIQDALRACDDNRREAAERLGVPLSTFYRRLEKLGLK